MDRLSSCYFCGDAVDAALEEYPLVDVDRFADVDTGQRIVLCPSCRRKLTTVIERVLEAALNGDSDGEPDDIAALADDEPLVDLEDTGETQHNGEEMTPTNVEPIGRAATTEAADPDRSEDATEDSDAERPYSSSTAAGDRDSPGEPSGDAEETADGSIGTGEKTAGEETTEETADDDAGEVTGDNAGEEAAGETVDDGDDATAESAVEESYTRTEHNKVVRLLQNRDFPVEIEEITVVARSAYGIDRDTTHEILESLIDRGVVEDKGDHLVRP